MHDAKHSQKDSFFTQYGPIGMSSPVSTGILKFCGGGACSAQNSFSVLGTPVLSSPPAWSRGGRAAPRLPTLCKRRASFRTTKQLPWGLIRVDKDHGEVKTPRDKKGNGSKGETPHRNWKKGFRSVVWKRNVTFWGRLVRKVEATEAEGA